MSGDRGRRPRWRVLVILGLALLGVAAGALISSTVWGERAPRGIRAVEAMFETYAARGPEAALEHFSPEVAERFEDQMAGLAVWSDTLHVIVPCRDGRDGAIICVMEEQHAIHEAAGLDPFENTFTLRVNDSGQINYVSQSVPNHFRTYYVFRSRYRIWLLDHPEASAREIGFPGNYQGPSSYFNAEAAAAVLEYVDEFVAQSDDYPPPPVATG